MSDIITVTVNNDEIHRLIVNAMADSDFVTESRMEDFIDRYDFESVTAEVIRDYDFDHIIEDFVRGQGLDEDSITDLVNDRIADEVPEFMRGYKAEINDLIADLTELEDKVREQNLHIKILVRRINKPSLFRRLLTNLYKSVAKVGLWRRGY